MEIESLEKETEKYPLIYLNNTSLDTDKRYSYLKSKLEDFYSLYNSNKLAIVYEKKSVIWNKQLHLNLHLLLAEIVITQDQSQKLDALESTYSWYTSKTKSPDFNESLQKFPSKLTINLPFLNNSKNLTPTKQFRPYIPEKILPKKEDVDYELIQRHQEMINNEKISFNCGEIRNKLKKNSNNNVESLSFNKEEKMKKENISGISKTPDLNIENSQDAYSGRFMHDFRSFSHKAKMIALPKGTNKNFGQMHAKNIEFDEIYKIKSKLAHKNLNVSIKALENALVIYNEQPIEGFGHLDLPKGGEFLVRSPKPAFASSAKKRKKAPTKKSKKL